MRPLHARLVREAKRRDPKFAPRPFTAKALEPIRRWLGTIPDDYRAFLLEIGRLTGSLTIGHPSDFDLTELPDDFLPFAEDDEHVYAYAKLVDERQLAEDLRGSAVEKRSDLDTDLEEGNVDDEDAEERRAEIAEIEGEVERLEGDGPIRFGIASWNKHDGEVTRRKDTFEFWLERITAPKPKAPAAAPKAAATGIAEADLARALDLIDLLVATEKLEIDASFDEKACAKKLAKHLDDAERVAEILVDVRGVVELYATELEIETALSRD